jgi:hypothetical protein
MGIKRNFSVLYAALFAVIAGVLAFMGLGQLGFGAKMPLSSPLHCKADSQNCRESAQGFARGQDNTPYRFIAFGDWGAGTPFQKAVAAQAIRLYQHEPYDAVLLLGDNFYERGDVRKLGQPYFTDMYAPLIQGGVQFVVALGNHDRLGGFQNDQVNFFQMPGYYYTVKKPGIQFFVLDSNMFANDQVQRKWLEKALADSKSPWKIVMAHHPIYSSGEHGFNAGLQKTLEPLLIRYKADLYLAGHDHDYERFAPIHGVQYIVSGGGGAYLRNFDKPMPGSLVRIKAHHFLSFDLQGNTLKMQVIDSTGKCIDQAQWQKMPMPLRKTERKQLIEP